jgi:hypothetical protein
VSAEDVIGGIGEVPEDIDPFKLTVLLQISRVAVFRVYRSRSGWGVAGQWIGAAVASRGVNSQRK